MSHSPMDPDRLHAYVDGQLPDAERAAVDAWLAAHPDEGAKVRAWKRDADQLRSTWGHTAALPDAPWLDPVRIRQRLRAQRRTRLAQAAVLVLALGLGGLGGWQLRGTQTAGDNLPMADAVTAYRMFASQPVSMDFEGDRIGGLQDWLSRHFDEAGRIPDLSAQGYALYGARVLSTPEGAAAMLVYVDGQGGTLGVYLRPRTQRMREGARNDGGLLAQYWAQGDTAIAVVGSRFDPRARGVAPLVRSGG
ncbi:anti-sigma factor [Pseudoxanthomonas putridarboris]|uniref:Anti-sigma factor n=1 Tax=Pseudoxanthomonas putridarboris TaxID=752605 RepID=A0ABU9J3Y3_9GAMM